MEDIRIVLEMLVIKTEVAEAEEHEINKAHEESWTTVKPRKDKARKERTGLISDSRSEIEDVDDMYSLAQMCIPDTTTWGGSSSRMEYNA